jgi:hypothetical protein
MASALLRFYSYAFQFLISIILFALGSVAALSDNTGFEIDFLPWSGKELRMALLILGASGILAILLAIKGKLRFLFVLWALVITYLVARGIFASPHQFDGESEFKWALLLLCAVMVTVIGAWSRLRQPLRR